MNYVDAIGWLGVASLLAAYALVSTKKLEGDSIAYQLLNLGGGLFLRLRQTPTSRVSSKQPSPSRLAKLRRILALLFGQMLLFWLPPRLIRFCWGRWVVAYTLLRNGLIWLQS